MLTFIFGFIVGVAVSLIGLALLAWLSVAIDSQDPDILK